jgi:hypothetical protein
VANSSATDFAAEGAKRQKTLNSYISTLSNNVTYWGEKNKTGLAVIELYTLAATIIMAINLALKENIQNVGGWIPFCLVATILTGIATYYVNSQKSEDSGTNRSRCLQAIMDCRALERKLSAASEWNLRKMQAFDKSMAKLEADYALMLTPPPRVKREGVMFAILFGVVVLYLAYEFPRAAGSDWPTLLNTKSK